jgi:WD40 repeat protein
VFEDDEPPSSSIYQWTKYAQLGADIDGEAAGDQSGYSVSLSSDGTIVAIGAHFNGSSRGHVRVYKWTGISWVQLGADIDGEAAADYFGISVSLSSDGTIVAIGAILNDGTGSNAGHVRVFKYLSTTLTQLGADIDGEAAGDQSGISVSLSSDGTIVAIGAINNGGTASNAGHVRIFKYISTTWIKVGLDIDGEAAGDNSRFSVSLSSDGSVLAVGGYKQRWNGFQCRTCSGI